MKFNHELAAQALLEALLTTDDEACAKYGITTRTLRRYRERQKSDPRLSALVHTKKEEAYSDWTVALPGAMREAAQAIEAIATSIGSDPAMRRNPFALEKLAGALKLCAEVYYTGKVIDARLAGQNRSPGQLLGEGATESGSQYSN